MKTFEDFRQAFKGNIIVPGDPGYEQASVAMAHKGSPTVIAMAKSPGDVVHAIAYARKHSLVVSMRSGGHSSAGFSTNDGGIIIDVSQMNDVTILDTSTGHVRIGAGARWGDISKILDADGLGISSGDTVSVGVSGLTFGAGIGWLVRKYGLTLDSLQSVELVTAESKIITASESSHPDLFWALSGGGGNFGVATAFEFIAHPVSQVYFGSIEFAPTDLAAWLKGWRDVMRSAPEELTTTVGMLPKNLMGQNAAAYMVLCCWDGDDEVAANAALAPIRALAPVLNDSIAKKHYYEILREAHTPPQGMHSEVNNALFNDFSDEVIQKIADAHQKGGLFEIRSVGGAMGRVASSATAFAHRNSEVLVVAPQFFPSTATEEAIQQGLQVWYDIAATSQGAYINFFSRATEREVKAAYPTATYQKLAAVKKMYDPHNLFNQNINIKPAE